MRTPFLSSRHITMNLRAQTREEAICELVSLFCRTESRSDDREIINAVLERERKASTGIQWGIAIPHARLNSVDRVVLCIGYSSSGIDFSSPDESPAHIIMLILSPERDWDGHIRFLVALSGSLSSERWRRRLVAASTPEEVVKVFQGGVYGSV